MVIGESTGQRINLILYWQTVCLRTPITQAGCHFVYGGDMAVLKVEKSSDYTVIDNNIFKNKDLSLKAKGLLCLMLSLPDNWDYTLTGLSTLSRDGVEATRSALNELESNNYFRRVQQRVGGKFEDVEYVISEKPLSENPISVNPPQLNTNILNTKEPIDYKGIISAYNQICTRLVGCERLTQRRKTHIKARIAQCGYEELELAFRKANDSDFLCGMNGRGWRADFDWLMKNEDNITKVLEGKYDNGHKAGAEAELMKAYNAIRSGSNDNRPFGS